MRALLDWVASGNKPSPGGVTNQRASAAASFEPQTGCQFLPEFQPQPFSTKVPSK